MTTISRYFYREAGNPQAPGSSYFADVDSCARAAIRFARQFDHDVTVFECGSRPYPKAVRDIPAAKARGVLGAWTER